MADQGTIKFKNGTAINIDVEQYQKRYQDDWPEILEAQIQGLEKDRGKRLMVNVPGFSGNMEATPDQVLHGDQEMKELRNPIAPWQKSGVKMTEEGIRQKTDWLPILGGFAELAPGPQRAPGMVKKTLGVLTGAPARAGAGATAGGVARDYVNAIHGVPSRPNQRSALGEGTIAGAGEALLRIPFAARRFVQRTFLAGADQAAARQARQQLNDLGIESPRLDQILKDTGEKHSLHESLYNWAARNFAGAPIIRQAAEQSQRQINDAFQRMWVVRSGRRTELTPDVVRAGGAFKRGYSEYDEGWREVGNQHYANFFNKLARVAPEGAPAEWSATKAFLEDRASLDPLLGAMSSDKLKGLHNAFDEYYTKTFRKNAVTGEPLIIQREQPVDFELLKRLRTQVGHKISSFDPGQEIAKDELLGLYGALTEDMKKAAQKYGVLDEFETANTFWKAHKEFQDGIIDNISKKVSNQKVGAAIESLIRSNDYQNLGNIKGALGPNSREWAEIQNYTVRQLGMGAGDTFDIDVLYRKWGGLNEGTKRVLAGRGEARKALDDYMEAVEKWGPRFSKANRTTYGRFTFAETYGPAALLTGGAYGVGTAGERDWKDGVAYAAVTAALALAAPRHVARLLVDPQYTNWATQAFKSDSLEQFAGMVSRLGAQYKMASPEQQAAVSELMYNISLVIPTPREMMQPQQGQGAPGVLGGQ